MCEAQILTTTVDSPIRRQSAEENRKKLRKDNTTREDKAEEFEDKNNVENSNNNRSKVELHHRHRMFSLALTSFCCSRVYRQVLIYVQSREEKRIFSSLFFFVFSLSNEKRTTNDWIRSFIFTYSD